MALGLWSQRVGAVDVGQEALLFIRPEAIEIGRSARELPAGEPAWTATVQSVLFDGGNSTVQVREDKSDTALQIALPLTGRLADLRHGETVCFLLPARAGLVLSRPEPMSDIATHRRWMLAFLLAPALLWLGGLVVLPHVELALLSLQARVGPGEYAFSLNQFRTFVDEPLYWNTFVRTAVMSVLATVVHAAAGLSRSPGTSPRSPRGGSRW